MNQMRRKVLRWCTSGSFEQREVSHFSGMVSSLGSFFGMGHTWADWIKGTSKAKPNPRKSVHQVVLGCPESVPPDKIWTT